MPGVTFFCVFVWPETNRKGGGNHPLGRTKVKVEKYLNGFSLQAHNCQK